jgi:hypothetical protein
VSPRAEGRGETRGRYHRRGGKEVCRGHCAESPLEGPRQTAARGGGDVVQKGFVAPVLALQACFSSLLGGVAAALGWSSRATAPLTAGDREASPENRGWGTPGDGDGAKLLGTRCGAWKSPTGVPEKSRRLSLISCCPSSFQFHLSVGSSTQLSVQVIFAPVVIGGAGVATAGGTTVVVVVIVVGSLRPAKTP